MTSSERSPWWKEAVFYQIYPRSFCLADPQARMQRLAGGGAGGARGESRCTPARQSSLVYGAGDLEGIRRHLDYLVWLGVDAVWLSPFYSSPMRDFGYDVSDHRAVDPLFGSLDDFDRLLADAHARGLRLIVDFVPNHTSDEHPWFVAARSSRSSPYRDFYVWRDPDPRRPERPPNNWLRSFGEGPAWTFDRATGQWYLHLFLPEQPDLNWSNPAVADAMEEVLRFWLERGVDGFRVDVAHALGKDPALPDAPQETAGIPWSGLNDDERTHPILRRLRRFVDSWPHEPVLVGEVYLLKTARVAKYYGDGDELHLAFNFPPMFCPFEAACFKRRLAEAERLLAAPRAWPTWVLSSHDRSRHRTRYGGSERRARAAAVVLLSLRGTPFLYAGEELGLEDAVVPADRAVDPGGRDGCRAPIPWEPGPVHGWELAGSEPWLPFPPGANTANVRSLAADDSSILHLYRRILAARRAAPSLRVGSLDILEAPEDVLAVRRADGDDERYVAVNFAARPVAWTPPGRAGTTPGALTALHLIVEISTGGESARSREGTGFTGVLGPEEGVILRPS